MNRELQFVLIIFLLLSFSCKKPGKTKVSHSEVDSIEIAFHGSYDSIKVCWNRMITDDDEKLFHIKRLLEEISYTNNYDQEIYDSLMTLQEELVALRYDQQSMSNSDLIDDYDIRTAELIKKVITFSKNHPDFKKYPLMSELIMDIQEADNRVLLHRIKYDNFCRIYNEIISQHEDIVTRINPQSLEKKALFTLYE